MKQEKTFLGFKNLTENNWSEPDSLNNYIVRRNTQTGEISLPSGDDWAKLFLEPQLNEDVPTPVRRLYEVSRGTLIYGFNFYPLYTLGVEQLSRVAECAITEKCLRLNLLPVNPKKKRDTFSEKLKALEKANIDFDIDYWEVTKELRNQFSHPKDQSLIPPGISLGFLTGMTKEINILFS